jgi:pimeloyl-ACP methyl ester carboxylesterase
MLPGRAVMADPPGFGRTPRLDPCNFAALVNVARTAVKDRACRAMVGHSLGAHVALGVGCDPPAGLNAIVLIDGGFMTGTDFAAHGIPVLSGHSELVAWVGSNRPRFPDWDSAIQQLAQMSGAEATPAFAAYVHEVMAEADGEVCSTTSPEHAADTLLACTEEDPVALAHRLEVPTLLIACGQPADSRAIREKAWQAFVGASPLLELQVADDWGHGALWQAPEASSTLIADWLRDHM